MIIDFFQYGVANLRKRKIRTWLTMIGIFIGIAAVVSLISLGQGLQASINDQFETLGADKITVTAGTGLTGPPGSGFSSAQLTTTDVNIIKKISGIKNVATLAFKQGKLEYQNEIKYSIIEALPLQEDLKPRCLRLLKASLR